MRPAGELAPSREAWRACLPLRRRHRRSGRHRATRPAVLPSPSPRGDSERGLVGRCVGVHRGDFTTAMLPDVSSRQTKGEQRMHDLLQIEVVGSKSDWFVLGLDKYGIVWSGTPRPVGATFELDWVRSMKTSRRRSSFLRSCSRSFYFRVAGTEVNPVRRRRRVAFLSSPRNPRRQGVSRQLADPFVVFA